jgi:predicted P-loop ATPase
VWAGTTNSDDWVEDPTGARRMWPVACTEIDLDYLSHNREQLFAEAVYRYKAGESWWDIDPELARTEQDARRSEDPWSDAVLLYARTFSEVRVPDILTNALKLLPHQQDKTAEMRVASILRVSNYRRRTVRKGDQILKSWLKC